MIIVSKVRIIPGEDLNIPINIEQRFDITGQNMLLKEFDEEVLQEIINPTIDFEIQRNTHQPDSNGMDDLYMVMAFISGDTTGNTWIDEYTVQGFDEMELFKYSDAVKNSFFKFDFYDTPNREQQKLKFTKIIPMYLSNLAIYDKDLDGIPDFEDTDVEGEDLSGSVSLGQTQNEAEFISEFSDRLTTLITQNTIGSYAIPNFHSNFLKNNEISNILYFRSDDAQQSRGVDVETFYVSCRFFNGKTGEVVRMVNDPKPDGGVNPKEDFYYLLEINSNTKTYVYYNYDGVKGSRIGDSPNNPIPFYQMI